MIETLQDALRASGLNVSGVADGRPYDGLLPGCRAVVVFASGGRALWEAFTDDLRQHPAHLTEQAHPLDRFIARAIERADPDPRAPRRWVRCAADESVFLDFRKLAIAAGLGWPSQLGLVLHPTYGPWLGLRAACLTTAPLPIDGPLVGPSPCVSCPGHCAQACPGSAFRDGALKIRKCVAYRAASPTCATTCAARRACPEGKTHQYHPAELAYHMDPAHGQRVLRSRLGVEGAVGVFPQTGDDRADV